MRFYLFDKITEIKYEEYAKGVKCVSLSDDILNEHFPYNPLFPGTMTIESLAQLSGIHFNLSFINKGIDKIFPILIKVDKMKFTGLIKPGDRMDLYAEIESFEAEFGRANVHAMVDDKKVASGKIMFAFHKLEDKRLIEIRNDH